MPNTSTVRLQGGAIETRWTWITALLFLYHLLFVLPSLIRPPHPSQQPKYPVAVFLFVLGMQWLGFYIAWRGIRASGHSFSDLFGKQSLPDLPSLNDCKDGFVILIIAWGINLVLNHIQPFTHSSALHTHTLLQYGIALLIAISAGITEEVTYRGLFLSQLRFLTGNLRVAILLQAALFALFHGFQQNVTLSLSRFFYGLLFAFIAIRRNSLWPAIVGHVMVDVIGVTIQYFKYR